jgi:hypothetical protein
VTIYGPEVSYANRYSKPIQLPVMQDLKYIKPQDGGQAKFSFSFCFYSNNQLTNGARHVDVSRR